MVTLRLLYPDHGRGAWTPIGGTLNSAGTAPGGYYRAPAGSLPMPGLVAYRGLQNGDIIDINSYAVFIAVKGIQREVDTETDGLFGPGTAAAVKKWQAANGLEADGAVGEKTAKAMFVPIARNIAASVSTSSTVSKLTLAHVAFESSWDPGAIGYVEPRDLGLGQINGSAHSDLTPDFRLTPRYALGFVANFVLDNLEAMVWNERDAVAAYNLGATGARSWVRAGRPDVWNRIEVKQYIDGVLAQA